MKSEKAKAIIRENDFYFSINGVAFHESRAMMKRDAVKAVELAEQEAEERMREKAVKAFDDMWFSGMEPDYEYHRGNFIKKLNEE